MNFDNGIKEAQLANSSALAQIAYNALQNELELSLQGFKYKNELTLQKEAQLQNINDSYYARWQDVLAQINTEIERQRQQDEREEANRQWWEEFNLKKQQYAIENSRAERQLQNALANEGNYIVNSGGNGSIGNVAAQAGVGAINSINGNAMSSNAQNVYNYIQKNKSNLFSSGVGKQISNYAVRNYIKKQYNNNMISDNDAKILFEKFGV